MILSLETNEDCSENENVERRRAHTRRRAGTTIEIVDVIEVKDQDPKCLHTSAFQSLDK